MLATLLRALLVFVLTSRIKSYPADPASKTPVFSQKSEPTWLWGWAWGAESTVSVVDHTPVVSFPSRPASFGAEINDPIMGYVIPVSSFSLPCPADGSAALSSAPNNGCPPLCLTAPNYPTDTWIALVQRGQCEFVKKVREAQRMGAKAVVVGGEDPAISGYPDTLVNMYSPEDASDIKIAATYIKFSDYMQLWQFIEASNTTHSGMRTLSVLITAEYSAWEWYSPIITFIIILLLPSALTFLTLLIHRIRAARAAQRDRAPEGIVHNLPWCIWTGSGWEKHEGPANANPPPESPVEETGPQSGETALRPEGGDGNPSSSHNQFSSPVFPWYESQVECAICLCEFVKGDRVRVLPCHHIFHMDEIDSWLIQRKKLCPVCKADVTKTPTAPTERTPLLAQNRGAQS